MYSTAKYLTFHPVCNKEPRFAPNLDDNVNRSRWYKELQRNDEWAGENYEGTSVRASFKVLKRLGYINEYRWAQNIEDIVNHVLEKGPVVMGTTWTMDMFTPDRAGYIWFEGEFAGGHAWLIVGAHRGRKNPDGSFGAVRMINSWGPNWAQRGRAWLTFKTLAALLADYGEAGVATEVKRAP